jgi:MFS family permease
MQPPDASPRTLWSLALPMYLPAFLLAVGDGAMNTFLPLFLIQLGTGVAGAALLVGIGGAGVLLLDVPSGFIVARYGERRVLLASGVIMVLAALLIAASPSPGVAALGVFLASAAASSWVLGRLEFMRKRLVTTSRGRGLSTVGGVMRAGLLLGPLLGGIAAAAAGYRVVFVGVAALAALALVMFAASGAGREEGAASASGGEGVPAAVDSAPRRAAPLWDARALGRVLRERRSILITAGVSMAVLSMARNARSLILPLWGQAMGLGDAGIGLAVGISAAGDTLMFIPAGLLSDRKGRKWSAVSCLLVFSAGMACIPLARTLGAFLLVGLVVGLGNGLGSGINMTLGADFAADSEPGVFLGVWRLITDIGGGAAPFVVGAVTGIVALGPAAFVIAGAGLVGGVFHAAFVPETNKRVPRSR